MKNQLIIISLFLSIAYCKADTKNLCDLGNDTFSRNVFIIANAKMTTPYCSFFLDFGSPGISVKNIRDKGVVHSGFIVGTATDNQEISTVEIQIDSGTYAKPQVVSSRFVYTGNSQYHLVDWSFKLPTGTNSWKDGSSHTLNFRSRDTAGNYSVLTSLSVRKGENKDINGDGFSDSVVSANTIDTIYIFHGSTNGIAATAYNSGVTKTLVGAGGSAFGWGVGL
ncbi:MAG: hypothetical protein K8R21_03275, partial [Leptospira sp.]|nr:hypothetical protein [Leptospira sp.]